MSNNKNAKAEQLRKKEQSTHSGQTVTEQADIDQTNADQTDADQTDADQADSDQTDADQADSDQADANEQPEKFRKISIDGTDDRMPHSKPVKKSLHADRNLDMLEMSRKERRAAKKELYQKNTEGMTRKEKSKYFFDYYKWHVITPILIAAFICCLSVTIYLNKRPVALGFVILNAQDTETVDLSFEDDYIEHFGITGSYQFKESVGMDIDYDYYLEHSEYIQTSNSTDYNVLMSDCDLGTYDVIISNETGIRYCSSQRVSKALKGYLSETAYAALEPYMVEFEDPNGTERTYAIDISGTDFAKSLNPGYSDVYVAFPGVTDTNYTNSLRFLEYVLGIDLGE